MLDFLQGKRTRKVRSKLVTDGQVPFGFMMPQSDWKVPAFPSLSGVRRFALDTEGHDPYLKEAGPGWRFGDCKLCGVSVAFDNWKGYFPLDHPDTANVPSEHLKRWLLELFSIAEYGVMANAGYDIGNLWRGLGIEVTCPIHDIQIIEPLLDEESPQGYSLNVLANKYLGRGKNEDLMVSAANAMGLTLRGENVKTVIHKLPAKFVGPYAEDDAAETLQIFDKQWPLIAAERLEKVYAVEQSLVKTLHLMTRRGIRVDIEKGNRLNEQWGADEEELYYQMGFREIWDEVACSRYLRREGIDHRGSVKKEVLEVIDHPAALKLRTARAIQRTRSIYLEQNLLKNARNGRIHPEYVQMNSDDGGTRTGRLASKKPNGQQFPKRSTLFSAKDLRGVLIPEEGCQWAKFDYWSQEPIFQCHYGLLENLPGAKEVAQKFAENVKLYTFIEERTGGRCTYDQAKAVALGRSYGMGKAKMASSLHMPIDECGEILAAFDEAAAYIGILAERFSSVAATRGYIRDVLGRRRRFNLWQPIITREERQDIWTIKSNPVNDAIKILGFQRFSMLSELMKAKPGPQAEVQAQWPNRALERAFTYKAFNGGIQGSAASQTKLALVQVHQSVVLPQMTVHDEISASVETEKQAYQIKEIMENCIRLRLPAKADMDLGVSWC